MVTAQAFIEEARSWVGVPFRHQGRDARGVDCIGLPIVVLQHLGVLPPKFESMDYVRQPTTAALLQRLTHHCQPLSQTVPGSIIAIQWRKWAAHVAICTGDSIIHSYQSIGTVVEHGYRGRWVRMTHSIWAPPGVQL